MCEVGRLCPCLVTHGILGTVNSWHRESSTCQFLVSGTVRRVPQTRFSSPQSRSVRSVVPGPSQAPVSKPAPRTKGTKARSPRRSRRVCSAIWMWLLVAGAHTAGPWADRTEGCLTRERRLSWMWSSEEWKFLSLSLKLFGGICSNLCWNHHCLWCFVPSFFEWWLVFFSIAYFVQTL